LAKFSGLFIVPTDYAIKRFEPFWHSSWRLLDRFVRQINW